MINDREQQNLPLLMRLTLLKTFFSATKHHLPAFITHLKLKFLAHLKFRLVIDSFSAFISSFVTGKSSILSGNHLSKHSLS